MRADKIQTMAAEVDSPPIVPMRKKVLIAEDDNIDAAESLSTLLELAGHEVRIARLAAPHFRSRSCSAPTPPCSTSGCPT